MWDWRGKVESILAGGRLGGSINDIYCIKGSSAWPYLQPPYMLRINSCPAMTTLHLTVKLFQVNTRCTFCTVHIFKTLRWKVEDQDRLKHIGWDLNCQSQCEIRQAIMKLSEKYLRGMQRGRVIRSSLPPPRVQLKKKKFRKTAFSP